MAYSPAGVALRGFGPYVLIFGAALLMHYVAGPAVGPFPAKMLSNIAIGIIMAVSLNVVNGFTGQFSIGHAGFLALGAYASGVVTYYGSFKIFGDANIHGAFPGAGDALFLVAMVVGGAVAAVLGYAVGLPSLRLSGDYLAIVTLGFGEIVSTILKLSRDVLVSKSAVDATPIYALPLHVGSAIGFDGIPKYSNLFWATLMAGVTVLVCLRLKESIRGRAYLSIRENEVAAEAMGVPTTRLKVKAFVIAAFFAGVGGALFAHDTGNLPTPNELGFQKSLDYVIMVVLGGMGSISGSIVAAIVLTLLPEILRNLAWIPGLPESMHDASQYRLVIYAGLLILIMLARPQGLFGIHEIWELKIVRRIFGKRAGAAANA
ncbi:branched-chain amino acid ABC transporter permease [soil metagenome]